MNSALAWLRLIYLFFRELTTSVKDVALMVIKPTSEIRSSILAIPLELKSDAGITLFANMVTLTPGTTSLHVSEDKTVLYCHVMNASESTVTEIKNTFERSVQEVLS